MGLAGRSIIGTAAVIAVLLIGVLTYLNAQGIPEEELLRRCASSRPNWLSYQEDIKGQVGAAPVAAWKGEPIDIRVEEGRISITFQLASPWAEHQAALPVLVRDPQGQVYRSHEAQRQEGNRTYRFVAPEVSDPARIPWIDLRYPHTERRIPLDAQGAWHKPL